MGTLGKSSIREDLSGFDSDPRFKVGDRVRPTQDVGIVGVVEAVVVSFRYKVRSEAAKVVSTWDEIELQKYPKYTEKEAWIKAATLIGREVALNVKSGQLLNGDKNTIRQHALTIIGLAVIIGNADRQEVDDLIDLAVMDSIVYEARS